MKIDTGGRVVTPGDLPSILGARRAYRELGDMIEALISQLDVLAGDCDLESEEEIGIDDLPEGENAPLLPQYGPDQSAGPINYRHAEDFHKAAEAVAMSEEAGDAWCAARWRRHLDSLGAFDASRHGMLCEGYAA
ncbi:hypothetical protein [Sphingobium sp. TomMM35A]